MKPFMKQTTITNNVFQHIRTKIREVGGLPPSRQKHGHTHLNKNGYNTNPPSSADGTGLISSPFPNICSRV